MVNTIRPPTGTPHLPSPPLARPLHSHVPLNRRPTRVYLTQSSRHTPLSMVKVRTSSLKFHLLTGVLKGVYKYLSTSENRSPVIDGGAAKANAKRGASISSGLRPCGFACGVMGCSTLWSTID